MRRPGSSPGTSTKNKKEKYSMSFIAALDQSGGSTPGALLRYGCEFTADNAVDKMHEFRMRIMTSPSYNVRYIDGAILFNETVKRGGVESNTAAGVDSYLKVDVGLNQDGTMKPFDLRGAIQYAKDTGCVGTKMRSVVAEQDSIVSVLNQQFLFASQISDAGLLPIVEPEVPIAVSNKAEVEQALLEAISKFTQADTSHQCVLKLTLPEVPNLYAPLLDHPSVTRIVALSGGYSLEQATGRLSQNSNVSASFSRALTEGLKYQMSNAEFNEKIKQNIKLIDQASLA